MANPKNETSLAELKQRFADTDSLVLTEYRGLTVAQTTELRKALGAIRRPHRCCLYPRRSR